MKIEKIYDPGQIFADRVSINHKQIKKDYSSMWEYDPGEERPPNEASQRFDEFLAERTHPVAFAAFKAGKSGESQWIGSAFGYEKRHDQLINQEKQGTIASVFVNENERLQGAARQMVSRLIDYFQNELHFNGIQLYASPEGREVYLKQGFKDGDEMRYKLTHSSNHGVIRKIKILRNKSGRFWSRIRTGNQLLNPLNRGRIKIRQANNATDINFIIDNELHANGKTRDNTSQDQLTEYTSKLNRKTDEKALLIAYQRDQNGNEQLLGSAIAELWAYPVPDTFRSEGPRARRDLFSSLRATNSVSGATANATYLRLALKIIDFAEKKGFTQINIHQAGQAREILNQVGFTDGIHMQLQFEKRRESVL